MLLKAKGHEQHGDEPVLVADAVELRGGHLQ